MISWSLQVKLQLFEIKTKFHNSVTFVLRWNLALKWLVNLVFMISYVESKSFLFFPGATNPSKIVLIRLLTSETEIQSWITFNSMWNLIYTNLFDFWSRVMVHDTWWHKLKKLPEVRDNTILLIHGHVVKGGSRL